MLIWSFEWPFIGCLCQSVHTIGLDLQYTQILWFGMCAFSCSWDGDREATCQPVMFPADPSMQSSETSKQAGPLRFANNALLTNDLVYSALRYLRILKYLYFNGEHMHLR